MLRLQLIVPAVVRRCILSAHLLLHAIVLLIIGCHGTTSDPLSAPDASTDAVQSIDLEPIDRSGDTELAEPNRPPRALVIQSEPAVIQPNSTTSLTLSANAMDPDGDPLNFRWAFDPLLPSQTGQSVLLTVDGSSSLRVKVTVDDGRGGVIVGYMQIPLADALPTSVNGFPPAPTSIPDPPISGQGTFRFVVISDSNGVYGQEEQPITTSKAVEKIIATYKPDLVIHNGDMIAGQKSGQSETLLNSMWSHYHDVATLPLQSAGIPLVPVPGNHDADPSFLDRALYQKTWLDEKYQPAIMGLDLSHYPFYYSFDHNGVFFMVLDGATGSTLDDEQLAWIESELSTNGKPYPLRFVFSHVPLEKLRETDYGYLKKGQQLYQILVDNGASLFFTGHYEVYYKGFYKELPIVSEGFVSGGCHLLLGDSECQQKSFVIVDLIDGKIAQLFAVSWPGFDGIFDESTLPVSVGTYRRYDQPTQ